METERAMEPNPPCVYARRGLRILRRNARTRRGHRARADLAPLCVKTQPGVGF
jgi:hypothetical protein